MRSTLLLALLAGARTTTPDYDLGLFVKLGLARFGDVSCILYLTFSDTTVASNVDDCLAECEGIDWSLMTTLPSNFGTTPWAPFTWGAYDDNTPIDCDLPAIRAGGTTLVAVDYLQEWSHNPSHQFSDQCRCVFFVFSFPISFFFATLLYFLSVQV